MTVQLTRAGLVVPQGALEAVRAEFAQTPCVVLPRFLPPEDLTWFRDRIAAAPFEERIHADVTPPPVDLVMRSSDIEGRLHFLVNDRRLFAFVEQATGCGPIGNYLGTVYRMIPGRGHQDTWHTDVGDPHERLIALSLNLSEAPYAGGVFQLRELPSQRLLHEVANTGPGDALVFRIAPHLQHRVTEVTGTVPKMALAGWFRRTPRYADKIPRRPVRPVE